MNSKPNAVTFDDKVKWGCRDLNSDNRDPNAVVCQVSVQPLAMAVRLKILTLSIPIDSL